jgi:hypothetical protein
MRTLTLALVSAVALVAAIPAVAVDDDAFRAAGAYIKIARVPAEMYRADHGNSYLGMTVAKLAPYADLGTALVRIVWVTRKDYCMQKTIRGVVAHGFSPRARAIHHGRCPRRP